MWQYEPCLRAGLINHRSDGIRSERIPYWVTALRLNLRISQTDRGSYSDHLMTSTRWLDLLPVYFAHTDSAFLKALDRLYLHPVAFRDTKRGIVVAYLYPRKSISRGCATRVDVRG